jgi:hypothetical protein
MKKFTLILAILVVASASFADIIVNVPTGYTGLWRFENGSNLSSATFGSDIAFMQGHGSALNPSQPMVQDISSYYSYVGTPANNDLYGDNCAVQERTGEYMQITHNIASNGGGSKVNEYAILMDVRFNKQTAGKYNSLFQTSLNNSNDGDLFIYDELGNGRGILGCGSTSSGMPGYTTAKFDYTLDHRIVLSVDNRNFFQVYIDGTLFFNGLAQSIDGNYGLGSTFNLFADEDGEDAAGLVGTIMVWDHALTGQEISGMGNVNTTLVIPEPITLSVLALGALLLRRK